MAGSWFNIAIVMLCINIFLYIGATQIGAETIDLEGDILSKYLGKGYNGTSILNDASENPLSVNKSIISVPDKKTTESGGSTFLEILNALDVVFDAITIIFGIAFAPLLLFQISGIPYIIAFILAVPLTILFWLSIIQFIRGAS